jgi:hypothetical protein
MLMSMGYSIHAYTQGEDMVDTHNEREIETFLRLYQAQEDASVGTEEMALSHRALSALLAEVSFDALVLFASVIGTSDKDVACKVESFAIRGFQHGVDQLLVKMG